MKNFIMILMLAAGFALPAGAVCSVTGYCAPANSLLSTPNLPDKYMPNYLNDMQKPDAFLPQYRQPYYDMLINTEQPEQPAQQEFNNQSSYNSNCQFGICIPTTGMSEE